MEPDTSERVLNGGTTPAQESQNSQVEQQIDHSAHDVTEEPPTGMSDVADEEISQPSTAPVTAAKTTDAAKTTKKVSLILLYHLAWYSEACFTTPAHRRQTRYYINYSKGNCNAWCREIHHRQNDRGSIHGSQSETTTRFGDNATTVHPAHNFSS